MDTIKAIQVHLQEMQPHHYSAVKDIYAAGINTQNATLETQAPAWEEWDAKHLKACRIVALSENQVIGWAALSPVSGRCVYGGVAEDSVYVDPSFAGKGIGVLLLSDLVKRSEKAGIWTLQAHILVENVASRKLHSTCGFREIGIREGLGQLHGKWRDTCLMERRSKIVGV